MPQTGATGFLRIREEMGSSVNLPADYFAHWSWWPLFKSIQHPALEKLLRDCYNCPNPRIDRDIETLHEYKVLIYHFVSRLVSTMRSFFEPIGIWILKVKEREYIFFPFPPISKSLLAQYICFVPNNSFGRR